VAGIDSRERPDRRRFSVSMRPAAPITTFFMDLPFMLLELDAAGA
jgi:hypothetical protein